MTWLARLKKSAVAPETDPEKPTKPGFGGFGGTPAPTFQNSGGEPGAANDPAHVQDFGREAFEERAAIMEIDGGMSRKDAEALAGGDCAPDPDRHCWPHTKAMNTAEIDTFTARLHHFTRHGLDFTQAEQLADSLVQRDRTNDERRLCLECVHLKHGAGLWGCNQWRRAGLGAAGVPGDLVTALQRCEGFKNGAVPQSAKQGAAS